MLSTLLIVIGAVVLSTKLSDAKQLTKVLIAGSGVAGSTAALALLRAAPAGLKEIVLCEARERMFQPDLGGGLQLSGGSIILNNLGLQKELQALGLPFEKVLCTNTVGQEMYQLDVKSAFGSCVDLQRMSSGQLIGPYTIMRDALLDMLSKGISKASSKQGPKIQCLPKKRIVNIQEKDDKVIVQFSDGKSMDCDLLIGADGVNSAVGQSIKFPSVDGNIAPIIDKSDPAIRITYCVTPPHAKLGYNPRGNDASINEFHLFVGDGLHTLVASYGGLNGIQTMLALVYKSDANVQSNEENVDWQKAALQRTNMLDRIQKSGLGSQKEILSVLDAATSIKDGRVFDLGVKDRLIPLKTWSSSSGRQVLIGDSAHPMAPFLGQGANQAIQDGYYIAQLIADYNSQSTNSRMKAVSDIGQQLVNKRRTPTALLSLKSSFIGRIETLGGPVGVFVKENFFRTTGGLGIVKNEFLQAAIPKI